MSHQYAQIAFTESVRKMQSERGSRGAYERMDQGEDYGHVLSSKEIEFLQQRDSFYMASVGETGWPYVQHRGGPTGFVRVLDPQTLGFADFRGNRQYVSTGNLSGNDRVSLIFVDYPNRKRLKIYGRVEFVAADEVTAQLQVPDYRARIDQGVLISVEGYDWNCPQHITQRYSIADLQAAGIDTASLR